MTNKDDNDIETWICPKCKKETNEFPSLSRIDNKTEICSECSMAEAILNWGKHLIEQSKKEQE